MLWLCGLRGVWMLSHTCAPAELDHSILQRKRPPTPHKHPFSIHVRSCFSCCRHYCCLHHHKHQCVCSEKLLNDVYGYWSAKRKRWGKPILRRLQAPTVASDTNPYNTFRWVSVGLTEGAGLVRTGQEGLVCTALG